VAHDKNSTKELLSPFENPEQKFRSKRRLFDTPSLIESNSPKFDHNFDIEEQSEEELRETMTETMKHGSEHEDVNEHIEKVLEIVDLFHIPKVTQDQIMLCAFPEVILFYNGLDIPTRQILDSKGAIPSKTAADAKIAIQEMAEYSQKWHNGISSRTRSTETSDGLDAIQVQLNNLGREIKKVNEKVYAAQEFEAGDHVLLKVSPWKGVIHFGTKGKLAPRYVGPFEILERIGPVAYRLRFLEELSSMHDTFHVSNLKKCLVDANLHVPLDEIKIYKTLRFVEEPV
ncbi:hypothetical protein Tco_0885235, partial [Tanacetum coccineum]